MKALTIIIFSFALQGCLLFPTSTSVPHAAYKIELPHELSKENILNKIESILLKKGFLLEKNDWEVWEPLLSDEELIDKKLERTYYYNDIKLDYRPDSFNYIRLNYHEYNQKQFTTYGRNTYYQIKNSISKIGLVHSPQTDEDIKLARPVTNPENFNKSNPLPTSYQTAKEITVIAIGVVIYSILMLPFWFWLRKISIKYNYSIINKRIIFTIISAIIIFPIPVPMSMFGPFILVPGIFSIPFLFGLPANYLAVIVFSSIATGVVSAAASVWLLKRPLTSHCS